MKIDDTAVIIESLIRNLSHELRNPLTTIKGYAQLLSLKADDPLSVEKSYRMIKEQADRIDRMLQNLFAAFLPRKIEAYAFDAVTLVREMIASLQAEARVVTGASPAALPMEGDRNALAEIITLILEGYDWKGLSGSHCVLTMRERDGGGEIDIRFEGVEMVEVEESIFYLPFSLKKYYLKGTELYEAYFIAHACGWTILPLPLRDGHGAGFRIMI
ncbi:MAG TPA: histidine kinase dimerization/phospho-acceptor domain-containing protein [Spirochaetota bacterium]|nr:histidine kinase dimerization/phospho-acceptor domain-containing protein [Spirochaetota bacterium]